MLTLLFTNWAMADSITNIKFSHPPSSYFANGQNLAITFDYNTTEAGGVRIFARPFSGGALAPAYAASGSPNYPVGSGTGNGSFTISTGSVLVDQIRFQMFNDDQSQMLMEFFVDVPYTFGAHAVNNIQFARGDRASLQHGEDIDITFDYSTTEATGVRIFARPFTAGSLSPNYAASGSPAYTTGSGSGTGSFTISSGKVDVDQVRFRMTNDDQSQVLLDVFVDVAYLFSPHAIYNVVLTPGTSGALDNGDNVSISFDYKTSEASGVRIFARPFTDGNLTPSYAASGSPAYATGSGNGTGTFTISSGTPVVDHIRFQMTTDDQSAVLIEYFVPVHYLFSPHRVYNIAFDQQSPGYFTHGEQIDVSFEYATSDAGGIRIFSRPFTEGALTPNYAAQGSGLYPMGAGAGSGFFTISSNPAAIDHVRFALTNADQSATYLEYFEPVDYHFIDRPTSVANEDDFNLPTAYGLDQNFPNPFNPRTTIPYAVPETGQVELTVYDLLGRRVKTLVNEVKSPGRYEISFEADNLPSGMYMYALETSNTRLTKSLVLLK